MKIRMRNKFLWGFFVPTLLYVGSFCLLSRLAPSPLWVRFLVIALSAGGGMIQGLAYED
jgi:hypothetical protein